MDFNKGMRCSRAAFFFLLFVAYFVSATLGKTTDSDVTKCGVCRTLVGGFERELKRTARLNFAGGDVSWEEDKKLSYSTSETRLLEIMEQTCDSDHKHKCQHLLEEQEEDIERWWFKKRSKHSDLLEWLCISKMKVCCANNTYGEKCTPCPGGVDNPCGGFGTCEGAGDRKGSGKCNCNAGYAGPSCRECDGAYFDVDNSSAVKCERCHSACALGCTGFGPGDCDDCKSGWQEEDDVCQDVDECSRQLPPCQETGKYCTNTQGSYVCASCNKACADNCTGAGATSCRVCASGYERADLALPCLDVDECAVNESLCSAGTYCKNAAGSFLCRPCDVACSDGCSGPGPESCTNCAAGYKRENSTCTDIDECGSSPCDNVAEDCHNSAGTHSCVCKKGYIRADDRCMLKPKQSKEEDSDDDDEEDEEEEEDTPEKSAKAKKPSDKQTAKDEL